MLIKDKDDWLSSQESDTSEVDQSLADLMRNSKKRKIRSSTTPTMKRKKEQNPVLVKRKEKFTSCSSTDDTSDTEIEVEPNRPETSSGKNSKRKRLLIPKINAPIRKRNTVSKNDAATDDGGTRRMWGVDTTEDSVIWLPKMRW